MTSVLLFTGLVVQAFAGGEAEFQAANTAIAQNDMAKAEAHYRAALAAGGIDADVYYNLGNVLYRQEKLGPAILAWRRALALAPRDPDAAANLDFARRSVRDDVTAADPYPVWAPWQSALTAAEGQWIGGALLGAGLLVLALRGRSAHAPLAAIGGVLSGLGCVVGMGGILEAGLPPGGVVLAEEATAQSDLGGGVELFTLHVGAEVQIVEAAAGQVLVALGDGRRGWLPEAAVGRIDPWAQLP
ncbi:hypothetical protein LBMAG42_13180 [Deltaproteobacteria bacterium]|nr:hypothetical protein LBMAG42_13180 [Deltaproteobacteria bacterium]